MSENHSPKPVPLCCVVRVSHVSLDDKTAETMYGIDTILNHFNEKEINPSVYRSIIVLSFSMIENVFWTTVEKVVKSGVVENKIIQEIREDEQKRISIDQATRKWPKILTGQKFDWGNKYFSSLNDLRIERNYIIHSDRTQYYSDYIDNYQGASSAYYSSVEISKEILKHFNQVYKYSFYEKEYQSHQKILFNKLKSDALNKSISFLDNGNYPSSLKSVEEYDSVSAKMLKDCVAELFGNDCFIQVDQLSEPACCPVYVSDYFIDKIKTFKDNEKIAIVKKISPLFKVEKKIDFYGSKLGEYLPHKKLKISRIAFGKNHSYMCIPFGNYQILFTVTVNQVVKFCDILAVG